VTTLMYALTNDQWARPSVRALKSVHAYYNFTHFRRRRLFIFRGSVVAKIVGYNVLARPNKFVREVPMYVFEEMVEGRKLTEIINSQHENVRYLPGCMLPENIVSKLF